MRVNTVIPLPGGCSWLADPPGTTSMPMAARHYAFLTLLVRCALKKSSTSTSFGLTKGPGRKHQEAESLNDHTVGHALFAFARTPVSYKKFLCFGIVFCLSVMYDRSFVLSVKQVSVTANCSFSWPVDTAFISRHKVEIHRSLIRVFNLSNEIWLAIPQLQEVLVEEHHLFLISHQ